MGGVGGSAGGSGGGGESICVNVVSSTDSIVMPIVVATVASALVSLAAATDEFASRV